MSRPRYSATRLSAVSLVWLLSSCCPRTLVISPELYRVHIECGRRPATAGGFVPYDLFIPQPDAALPAPLWPAVVLSHGFARDHGRHRHNAEYLAARGIIVLTADLTSLIRGEPAQLDNIADAVGHVAWLAERSATPGNALYGLLDPARIALAGHSAGGAVSLEAAIDAQQSPTPVAAVALLDGVPWQRTVARAGDFPPIPLASWRSEPAGCNADGAILDVLAGLPQAVDDVRIVGGTHCDPENPSDALCGLACGCAAPQRQAQYQQFLYLFLRDTLAGPQLPTEPATYAKALGAAAARGAIVVGNSAARMRLRSGLNRSR
jgi:acetyl esterase/lipase